MTQKRSFDQTQEIIDNAVSKIRRKIPGMSVSTQVYDFANRELYSDSNFATSIASWGEVSGDLARLGVPMEELVSIARGEAQAWAIFTEARITHHIDCDYQDKFYDLSKNRVLLWRDRFLAVYDDFFLSKWFNRGVYDLEAIRQFRESDVDVELAVVLGG